MSVYPPAGESYHAVASPICPTGHPGEHLKNQKGELRFEKDGRPIIGTVKVVNCTPECEKWLETHYGWGREPGFVKKLHEKIEETVEPPRQNLGQRGGPSILHTPFNRS